ncbi:phage tail protein [Sulfurovum mangrovi]|uniref:phage tail protein n=1 Tax=Sulfurovum mangrovi TaxID=2893889 RepID=UPI001E588820|nr:phage tail protein [Sulfurovum mangrovi]UFH59976.1 phage tail protein [Sulfurovum mangrovi]
MASRKDPYKGFRFLVEIEGIVQAGFAEVTIPDSAQDPVEYREGSDLPTVRKIPGLIKYGNVVLKWGTTDSLELYEWRYQVESGLVASARKNMAVIVLDEEGQMAARWEFREAWPTKYDAPDLKASGNEIAIETLEIAHEGMRRVS